jgi:hypothetical protein
MTPARPSAPMRKMIADLVAKGCAVELRPDGTLYVQPARAAPSDPFDLVEMRK